MKKVVIAIVLAFVVFIGYVSSRNGQFNYERSGVIDAPAEKIFPYISDLKKGSQWSPYEKKDPNMRHLFSGPDAQVGSVMEFDGNAESGSGKLEILQLIPNELVEIKLTMIKPFHGENTIKYKLTPEGAGTRFSWGMSGDSGFMGKLLSVFIDCEKMVADDFSRGIENLKILIESQK